MTINFNSFLWKIRRSLLKPSDKRIVDFFVDDDDYQLQKLEEEVGKHNVKKAVSNGIIKIKKDEVDSLISMDIVYLTKDKGVPLMLARSHADIDWAKWAAIISFLSVIATVATPLYFKTEEESQKTAVYYYAFDGKSLGGEKEQDLNKVECWVNGINGRADTYKCSQGNRIITPCFRYDISDLVKCPIGPHSNHEAKYFKANFTKDTQPLMSAYQEEPTPWYILLSSGEECVFLNGATAAIANKRMDFGCKNSSISLYLPLKETDGTYTISCLKNDRLEQCRIKEMWL